VFAVGTDAVYNGLVLLYDGTSWSTIAVMTETSLYGIWGNSSSNVYAVGYTSTGDWAVILHFDGSSWSAMPNQLTGANGLNGVWGSAPSDVFAVGPDYYTGPVVIAHYDGSSWSAIATGTTANLQGVWGSSATDLFAVGQGGIILHYGQN
jgi:photosystem II stability/assembly factor-like uncharacterized protein